MRSRIWFHGSYADDDDDGDDDLGGTSRGRFVPSIEQFGPALVSYSSHEPDS